MWYDVCYLFEIRPNGHLGRTAGACCVHLSFEIPHLASCVHDVSPIRRLLMSHSSHSLEIYSVQIVR